MWAGIQYSSQENTLCSLSPLERGVLESVNTALLRTLNPDEVAWDMERAGEAEMDEMWSDTVGEF